MSAHICNNCGSNNLDADLENCNYQPTTVYYFCAGCGSFCGSETFNTREQEILEARYEQ
jgi:hypothetical protein